MSISNFDELVSAVSDWLDRDDLSSAVPTFIQLAEARMNRLLEDPEMDVRSISVATGDYTALPADFGEMISITTGNGPLRQVGPVEFAGFNSTSGTPRYYLMVDGAISFAPSNTTTPITMIYRRTIPALSASNTTNWLLSRAPDAYLYGALVQAEGFLAEDDRIAGWKAMFDEALSELRSDGSRRRWGAGGLAPRVRRP